MMKKNQICILTSFIVITSFFFYFNQVNAQQQSSINESKNSLSLLRKSISQHAERMYNNSGTNSLNMLKNIETSKRLSTFVSYPNLNCAGDPDYAILKELPCVNPHPNPKCSKYKTDSVQNLCLTKQEIHDIFSGYGYVEIFRDVDCHRSRDTVWFFQRNKCLPVEGSSNYFDCRNHVTKSCAGISCSQCNDTPFEEGQCFDATIVHCNPFGSQ
eukprot:gb/GECH01002484.1/.p1 GENE.gb/GECH01002484.1/~~gb/GECH01002484.1/.p1  ORF type:complete len:214 (+),score=33.22 gb/GECH01002484.1/:1-642(+)